MGDREEHLRFGLRRLAERGRIGRLSGIYKTSPWNADGVAPLSDQPDYFNAVCSLHLESLDPFAALALLKAVEREAGRITGTSGAPRTLDLDLLFWGDQVLHSESLILPHPRIALRKFVLLPLCEVAPDWIHPVSGRTVRRMLELCPDRGRVEFLKGWKVPTETTTEKPDGSPE